MRQVSDDEVMGHDDTLQKNLRSVYLHSETTTGGTVKVKCHVRHAVDSISYRLFMDRPVI